MGLATYNKFIDRISNGYYLQQNFRDELITAGVLQGTDLHPIHRICRPKTLPALPAGVTSYVITRFSLVSSVAGAWLVGQLYNLGNLNISTNVFTDGVAAPTITELGVSRQIPLLPFYEVAVVLNATPGNLSVTYVDQDNNTAEATTAAAMGVSSPILSAGSIKLNTTDTGVIDITTAARTGGTTPTGTVQFWGMRPISLMPASPLATHVYQDNLITSAFNPLRISGNISGFFIGSNAVKVCFGEMFIVGEE